MIWFNVTEQPGNLKNPSYFSLASTTRKIKYASKFSKIFANLIFINKLQLGYKQVKNNFNKRVPFIFEIAILHLENTVGSKYM